MALPLRQVGLGHLQPLPRLPDVEADPRRRLGFEHGVETGLPGRLELDALVSVLAMSRALAQVVSPLIGPSRAGRSPTANAGR